MINKFEKTYRWLSNFSPHPFTDNGGVRWKTSEHFYQCHKCLTEKDVRAIHGAKSPGKAKRLGAKVQMNPQFPEGKKDIMWVALQYKFVQNPDIRNKLIDTGDQILVEGNTWHDNTWGNCTCPDCEHIEGENILGLMLMDLRKLLKDGAFEVDDVKKYQG